jgi:hypothetical protein
MKIEIIKLKNGEKIVKMKMHLNLNLYDFCFLRLGIWYIAQRPTNSRGLKICVIFFF